MAHGRRKQGFSSKLEAGQAGAEPGAPNNYTNNAAYNYYIYIYIYKTTMMLIRTPLPLRITATTSRTAPDLGEDAEPGAHPTMRPIIPPMIIIYQ